jgi:glycosyltransferase involved in cell wall biosynthesis
MPAVVLADGRCEAKENLILSVGRFVGRPSDAWNSKRQDALIAAFSQLPLHLRRSWRLVLAGAAARSPAMDEYLDKLRQQAAGLNVSIETDVTPERLSSLQSRARLFWHAAGFERPRSLPEGAEHFGVATVEAMSHRAIPLVYADGGQLEIVSPQFGRLWTSIPDLVDKSVTLMEQSSAELDGMGDAARSASSRFGARRFEAEARELLNRLRIRQAPKRRAQLADTQRRKARSSIYRTKVRLYSVVSRLYRKSTGALRSNRTSALRSPEGA